MIVNDDLLCKDICVLKFNSLKLMKTWKLIQYHYFRLLVIHINIIISIRSGMIKDVWKWNWRIYLLNDSTWITEKCLVVLLYERIVKTVTLYGKCVLYFINIFCEEEERKQPQTN